MTLELVVPFFTHIYLAILKKCRPYMTIYGENSAKNVCFEDCIRELPDEIVALILSHLTIKDAIKTKALSKRWRHLYLSYLHASGSKLIFDFSTMFGLENEGFYKCGKYTSTFVQRVSNFLDQYKGPNISSFHVSFCIGRKYVYDIDRWITYAVKRDVEELSISCKVLGCWEHNSLYAFSFQLLSEATKLKHLVLHACMINPDFTGQFRSLKVLKLSKISINQSLLLCILSRCSNLERMSLSECLCSAVLSFCGPFLQLKLLTIFHCKGLKEIELSAARVTKFEHFSFDPTVNIVFSSFFSLESLCTRLTTEFSPFLNKTANSFPQLQSLSVLCFARSIKVFPCCTSTFGNLKQLELFFSCFDCPHDIRKIIPIICACPILQKLLLTIIRCSGRLNEDRNMIELDKYRHNELKEVEFTGFCYSENHLELALYFVENAIALERMVISSRFKLYHGFGLWSEDQAYSIGEVKRHQILKEHILKELQVKTTSKNAQVIIE